MSAGNFISESWKEQEKCFFENLGIIRQRPTKKSVHDLRVSVKKIRSFLRLQEKITGEKWQEEFEPVKILFKISGKQRDFEMSLTLLSKYQRKGNQSLPTFKKFLQLNKSFTLQNTKKAIFDFHDKELSHFTNNSYESLALFTNDELIRNIKKYTALVFDKAVDYTKDINENAHEIRKLLKDIYYWLIICPSNPAQNLIEIKQLTKILQHLGDWQDNFIFHKKLKYFRKEYLVNNTSEAEAVAGLEIKIKMKKDALLKKAKEILEKTIERK